MTRLNKYLLNEVTIIDDELIDEIIEDGIHTFKNLIAKSKFKFWPVIIGLLNLSFGKYKIYFYPRFLLKVDALAKSKGGNILISFKRKEYLKLKAENSIEWLRKILKNYLSHEFVHLKQFIKTPIEKIKFTTNLSDILYFSDPSEIDAFAKETVVELELYGKSEILTTYYNIVKKSNEKAWRRYIRNVFNQINNSKQKEQLYKKLSDEISINKLIGSLIGSLKHTKNPKEFDDIVDSLNKLTLKGKND